MSRIASILLVAAVIIPAQSALAKHLNETELENLVAPVALYPDILLAQVLDASQYPHDIVAAGDFLSKHDKDEQPDPNWPASVMALLQYPHVLTSLDDDLSWTTRLGNAEKHQKKDVEKAIQDVRKKARAAGNLVSNDHENIVVNNNTIDIVPTDPTMVYVPMYNPSLIYTPLPAYAPLVTFGAGVAVGAAFANHYDWDHYNYYHHGYYDHIGAWGGGAYVHGGAWDGAYTHGWHGGAYGPFYGGHATHIGGDDAGVTHIGGYGPYGRGGMTVGHVGDDWGAVGHHSGYGAWGGFHGGFAGYHAGFAGGGFHAGGFHMGGFRR